MIETLWKLVHYKINNYARNYFAMSTIANKQRTKWEEMKPFHLLYIVLIFCTYYAPHNNWIQAKSVLFILNDCMIENLGKWVH